MNDLEMMIADARDDGDGHRNVLSVVPKRDSPTKSTFQVFPQDGDESFDENATLRNVAKLWQTTALTSRSGNSGKGNDGGGGGESADMMLLKNKELDLPVILNVGGKKYEVRMTVIVDQSDGIVGQNDNIVDPNGKIVAQNDCRQNDYRQNDWTK